MESRASRSGRASKSGDQRVHLDMAEFIKLENINDQLNALDKAFEGDPTIDALEDFANSLQKQAAQAQEASRHESKWRMMATLSIIGFIAMAAVLFGIILAGIQITKDIKTDENNVLVDNDNAPIQTAAATSSANLDLITTLSDRQLVNIKAFAVPTERPDGKRTIEYFRRAFVRKLDYGFEILGKYPGTVFHINREDGIAFVIAPTGDVHRVVSEKINRHVQLMSEGVASKGSHNWVTGEIDGFNYEEHSKLKGHNDVLGDDRCTYTTLEQCSALCCENPDCRSFDYKPPWKGSHPKDCDGDPDECNNDEYYGCGKCCLSTQDHTTQPDDFEDRQNFWNYYDKIELGSCEQLPTPTEAPTPAPTENPTENPTEDPTDDPTEAPTDSSFCDTGQMECAMIHAQSVCTILINYGPPFNDQEGNACSETAGYGITPEPQP